MASKKQIHRIRLANGVCLTKKQLRAWEDGTATAAQEKRWMRHAAKCKVCDMAFMEAMTTVAENEIERIDPGSLAKARKRKPSNDPASTLKRFSSREDAIEYANKNLGYGFRMVESVPGRVRLQSASKRYTLTWPAHANDPGKKPAPRRPPVEHLDDCPEHCHRYYEHSPACVGRFRKGSEKCTCGRMTACTCPPAVRKRRLPLIHGRLPPRYTNRFRDPSKRRRKKR